MSFFSWMNEQVKKMDVWDISLTKLSVLFATLVLVRLIPELLEINVWLALAIALLAAARPLYKVYIKK